MADQNSENDHLNENENENEKQSIVSYWIWVADDKYDIIFLRRLHHFPIK